MTIKKIGLIGTGLMGRPMAKNWLKKSFPLSVLPHKNLQASVELKKMGASICTDLKELVQSSDVIVLMLPSSEEVEALTLGEKSLIDLMVPSQICIDMTTSNPKSTVKIFEKFKTKSLRFFDAPVTGGVKGAEAGALTLFVGGPLEWFEETKIILQAVSKTQGHFGKVGSGHIAKIINNFICVGNLSVFSEALPLSVKMGIDPQTMFETLLGGTASSEMLKYYGPQVIEGDFNPRFKLAHAYKDIKLAKDLAADLGFRFPVLEGMLEDFSSAQKAGLSEENLSALIKPIETALGALFRK